MNCKWKNNKYTLNSCKKEFFDKFPNSNLKIIELLPEYNLLIQNNYGICKVSKSNLFKGKLPTIQSAINKTEYFINQAKEVHGDKYDYSLVDYKDIYTKIKIICKEHKEFFQSPVLHLQKSGCSLCANLRRGDYNKLSTISFKEKANKVHNNKYDYSLVEYVKNNLKIKIICSIHKEFEQLPMCHMRGYGCAKCGNNLKSKYHSKNPTGWSKSNWWITSQKSKQYDSFKVYVLECWNDEEKFYKIGRTFRKINQRFKVNAEMPYTYKILEIFKFKDLTEENCIKCYDLETKLKNMNKENKYIPKIFFKGNKECFSKICDTELELLRETIKQL